MVVIPASAGGFGRFRPFALLREFHMPVAEDDVCSAAVDVADAGRIGPGARVDVTEGGTVSNSNHLGRRSDGRRADRRDTTAGVLKLDWSQSERDERGRFRLCSHRVVSVAGTRKQWPRKESEGTGAVRAS